MLSRPIINQSNISKFHQIIVKNVTASTALRIRLYANDGKDPCDKKDGEGGANDKCAEENKQRTCGEAGIESMLKQCAGATSGGSNGDKCAKKKPDCDDVPKNSCDKFEGDTQFARTSSSRKKKLKECVPPTQMDANTYTDYDKNISVKLYQNSEQNTFTNCFSDPEVTKNRRKTLKSCTQPPDWTKFDDSTDSPSKSYRISTKANMSNPDEVNADAFQTHTLEMLVKAVAKQVQANTFAIQNASIFRYNDDLCNDQGANKQMKMSQNTNQLRAASTPMKITNVSTPQIDSVLQYSTDGKKPEDTDTKKQIGRTLQEIIEDIENNYGKLPAPAGGVKEQKTEGDANQLMKSSGAPQATSLGKLYDQADLSKLPSRGHAELERSRPTHIPNSEGLPLPRSKPGQRGPPLTLDEFLKKLYEINVPQLRQTQAKTTPEQQTTPKQSLTQTASTQQQTSQQNAQSTTPSSTPPKTMSFSDLSKFRKIEIPFPKTMKENVETSAPVKTSHSINSSISNVLKEDKQQQQNANLAPASLISSTNTADNQNSDNMLRFADSGDKKDQTDASKKSSRITTSQLFENLNKPIKAMTDKSLNDIFKNAETANFRTANKNQRKNEKERGYDQFAKSFKIYKPPSEAQVKPTEVKPELPFEKMTPLNNLTPLEKHLMSMRAQKKTTTGKTVNTTLDPRFIPTLEGENRIDPTNFRSATTQSPSATATANASAAKNPTLKSTNDAQTASANAPVKAPETTNKGSGNVLKRFLKMIVSYFSK